MISSQEYLSKATAGTLTVRDFIEVLANEDHWKDDYSSGRKEWVWCGFVVPPFEAAQNALKKLEILERKARRSIPQTLKD